MMAICAGNSDMTFTDCEAKCGTYFGLMHCVNGWQEEVGAISVTGGSISCGQEAFLIKSHNAQIDLTDVDLKSGKDVIVHTIVNDDPCATKVTEPPYGVNVNLTDMNVTGDLIHDDNKERDMWVSLKSTTLIGKMKNVMLSMDGGSKWIASKNSNVTFTSDVNPAQIDAPKGITIKAIASENAEYTLASGGKLIVKTK
jgi:hypothetical protein